MSELNGMGCGELADVAAELALGVLTGRERAEALAHLDTCAGCRENVRQLTMTGEELLGLLPAMEPPAGFETRLMERLGLAAASPGPAGHISPVGQIPHSGRKRGGRPRYGRKGQAGRTRQMLAVAAVALAVIVSGLGGWGLRAATSSPARSPLASAALLSVSHQTVGTIFFSDGSPRWVYMSVDMGSGNSTVICQLEGRDGRVTTVGSFSLVGGYGSWGNPGPPDNGPLTGARLVSKDGTVLATARFSEK
ncbi:MAG TPA: hypothetical protein VE733_15790 [Streptosporangiaceae bacterium]|jgi:hypothetical protein|nr:hypothetical protein [Streptosporangiaceae bacterium]